MNKKKEVKAKPVKSGVAAHSSTGEVSNEAELKAFLLNIRDKMAEEVAAPIYAVTAMNQILSDTEILPLFNDENKELARDIWLRIKQGGFQMRNPPLLFGADSSVDGAAQA